MSMSDKKKRHDKETHWSGLTQWAREATNAMAPPAGIGRRHAAGSLVESKGEGSTWKDLEKGDTPVSTLHITIKKENPDVDHKYSAASLDRAGTVASTSSDYLDATEKPALWDHSGLHDEYLECNAGLKQSMVPINDQDIECGDFQDYENTIDTKMPADDSMGEASKCPSRLGISAVREDSGRRSNEFMDTTLDDKDMEYGGYGHYEKAIAAKVPATSQRHDRPVVHGEYAVRQLSDKDTGTDDEEDQGMKESNLNKSNVQEEELMLEAKALWQALCPSDLQPRQEDMELAAELVIAADKANARGQRPDSISTRHGLSSARSPHVDKGTSISDAASTDERGDYEDFVDTITEERPAPPAQQSCPSMPGAYAIHPRRDDNDDGGGDGEEQSTASSLEEMEYYQDPTTLDPVTAHVVDPGQEEQMVQQRLQERLRRTPVAEVVHEPFGAKARQRMLVGIVVLLVIALGVGLGVALKPAPPSGPPSEEELVELISFASPDGGAALRTNSTPQYQAFQWLLNNNSRLEYYSDERIKQRYALATFYYSTQGNNWIRNENWLDDGDECNRWSQPIGHLVCSDACLGGSTVIGLDMQQNNLQGLIPPEIALLSGLGGLNLKWNALTGMIPREITYLGALEYVDFTSNGLTGTVPTEIENLSHLFSLEFAKNFLTGTIPTVVGRLTNLERLGLNANEFNGTIPLEISKLTNMKYLNVRSNLLTGVIPSILGLMTRLEELFLYDNFFIGTIPLEILELTDLTKLNIRSNQLTGGIPTGIGRLTRLEQLSARSNLLNGKFPDELTQLTKLTTLNVRGNQLTGTIPTATGLLTGLEEYQIYDNELDGTIPTELGYLTKLTSLNIRSNKLVGSVPGVIYNLTTLEDLGLGSNGLVATIPSAIGRLTNLVQYSIFNIARLTSTIPSVIGLLTKLEGFEVQENLLTGSIPSVVNEMKTLVRFFVYNNNLTGNFTCPDFIADCFISCDDGFNESCRSL